MVLHDVADDPHLVKVPAQPSALAHRSVTISKCAQSIESRSRYRTSVRNRRNKRDQQ